jgi:mono/diheme cytochrome c family protein
MRIRNLRLLAICAVCACLRAQTANSPERDAGGVRAPTTRLERGRTVYVLNSCHFCHGVDLSATSMGAADLMHSALVGADVDGKLIGPIVTAGLPNLQTSMPSYSELTPVQISDLTAYVHYLRQQGKYKELHAAKLPVGDVAIGGKYFKEEGRCLNCHTVAALAAVVRTSSPENLKSKLLMPKIAEPAEGLLPDASAQAHMRLTENISRQMLANLLSYLVQPR